MEEGDGVILAKGRFDNGALNVGIETVVWYEISRSANGLILRGIRLFFGVLLGTMVIF